jgi:hypothetical protein
LSTRRSREKLLCTLRCRGPLFPDTDNISEARIAVKRPQVRVSFDFQVLRRGKAMLDGLPEFEIASSRLP